MNGARLAPALLIAHDAGGEVSLRRVEQLQPPGDASTVGLPTQDFDIGAVEPLLSDVGADDPFLVLHLVGPRDTADDEDLARLVEEIEGIHNKIRERHPGLRVLRPWVVHAVGRKIDDSETSLIGKLLSIASLRGVLVTATSSSASVSHNDRDQATFSADAATLLRVIELESQLATDPPSTWAFGVASVSYSAARLGQALSALHSSRMIGDHLLAKGKARDPAHDLGEDFIVGLDLGGDHEGVRLLSAPRGGTLLARIRMDDISFDGIPVTSWADAITTRHDILALRELPFILDRIDENAQDRLDELRDDAARATLDDLEKSHSLESAMRYCEGMRRGVESVLADLRGRRVPSGVDQTIADREKLRRLLRWLPFGPAVAMRLAALAILVLVVMAGLTGPRPGVVPDVTASRYPLGATATVLLLGGFLYFRRLRRTVRVRDRLAKGLEKLLERDVEEQVLEERIETLTRLRDWIGPRPEWWSTGPVPDQVPHRATTLSEWLAWLRHHTQAVKTLLDQRAASRDLPGLGSTPYAVDVPAPEELTTDELSHQLLDDPPTPKDGMRAMVLALRVDVDGRRLPVFGPEDLADRWSHWLEDKEIESAWPDLTALISENPSVATRARRVLETDVTPALDHAEPLVMHYLAVPGGEGGTLERAILDEDDNKVERTVSRRLTGIFEMPIPSFVAMVNLYRLQFAAEAGEAP